MALEAYGPGIYGPYYYAGVPAAGTDETQTATLANITGGTFRLVYEGARSAAITWSATTNTLLSRINTALDGMATLGTSWVVATDVALVSGNGTLLLTFSGGDVSKRNVSLITAVTSSLTGTVPTISIATTTPGVVATYRDAQKASGLVDVTNAIEYIKTGATGTGTYTKVGTQS